LQVRDGLAAVSVCSASKHFLFFVLGFFSAAFFAEISHFVLYAFFGSGSGWNESSSCVILALEYMATCHRPNNQSKK
jgi:hypothetical protein